MISELGGKAPMIVFADADIDQVLHELIFDINAKASFSFSALLYKFFRPLMALPSPHSLRQDKRASWVPGFSFTSQFTMNLWLS